MARRGVATERVYSGLIVLDLGLGVEARISGVYGVGVLMGACV